MTQADKVVKVAVSQIGYKESPANSNNTKYGRWMGVNYQPWCASFVVWCFYKAGLLNLVTKNASAAYLQDDIVNKRGGKWIMTKAYNNTKKKNALSKYRPGDVVTFDFGRNNGYRQHIGIIERVSGNYVICIEGNTSKAGSQSNGGMVCRQRRIYSSICAVARPKYSGKPEPLKPLDVDGEMGYETTTRLQRWLGVDEDGEIGKRTTLALQRKIGMPTKEQDGEWGTKTTKALQKYLTANGFSVKADGKFGKLSVKALQKYLNKVVTK